MTKPAEAEASTTFGFKDIFEGTREIVPGADFQNRRDIADSLRNIASHIIRMDASSDELSAYAQELQQLEQRMEAQGKVDTSELFKRMVNGEASADDVLMGHDFSILSGKSTAVGFPLETHIEGDRVFGRAYVPLPFQGPPMRVHGGIVAAIFDVLLAQTQAIGKVMGFTATLDITYKSATPLETELELEAWVEKVDGRKLFTAGEIRANGQVCASAKGLWIQPQSNFFGMGDA